MFQHNKHNALVSDQPLDPRNHVMRFPATRVKELQCIYSVHHLSIGDHVTYYKAPFQRHAIVTALGDAQPTMTLVRLVFTESGRKLTQPRFGAKTVHNIDIQRECGTRLRRVVYDGPCYDAVDVVSRATALLGRRVQSPHTDVAREFPIWCRTGRSCDVIKQVLHSNYCSEVSAADL